MSGRFSDDMIQQQSKLVHVSTQTSALYTETPALHVWPAVDRATSTEGACLMIDKKVKASHNRYRALGPGLISVYRQSACRWL